MHFEMPLLYNKGEEFKMDQSLNPALRFNDLRFYSTTISRRDIGWGPFWGHCRFEALFGIISKVEEYDDQLS